VGGALGRLEPLPVFLHRALGALHDRVERHELHLSTPRRKGGAF
jgi:hypothetical protein